MKLPSFTVCLAFLATMVSAGPIVTRTAASIVSSIQALQDDLITLNNTLNKFETNIMAISTAMKIKSQSKDVDFRLDALIRTTLGTSELNTKDTALIAATLTKFGPVIDSLIDNMVRHKPAFSSAVFMVGDLSKTVEKGLKKQQAAANKFVNALVPKLAKPMRDLAPPLIKKMNDKFQGAIDAFHNCKGMICLPAS